MFADTALRARAVVVMQSLDHPSIITLFDVFETDTHVQLVMEMCTGGELFDRIIAEQHFSEDKAAKVVRGCGIKAVTSAL